MRGIFKRTVGGSESTVFRGVRLVIRRRARLVAIVVVTSLLLASLPLSSGAAQESIRRSAFATDEQNSSSLVHLYRSVGASLASLGSWLTAGLRTTSSTDTWHMVAAYIPPPPFLDPPTSLQVTEVADDHINLSWTAPPGTVAYYQVERSASIGAPFQFVANVSSGTTYSDTSVVNLHSYLYRVRAFAAGGLPSTPSNMALGTAIEFEFNELDNQLVRARHFHDVRTAVDLVRGAAGLPVEDWDRDDLTGLFMLASDLTEIRDALNQALNALSIPVTPFQDPTLTVGVTIVQATHIEQLQSRSTRGISTSSGPLDPDSSAARLDPLNETGGENPLSRNLHWQLPLVSLPGRSGMDLGLTLSYNSLVWTKLGASTITFDDDNGWPGPGFRLGFPVIQAPYFNNEVGKYAYLLIASDGSRKELRQVPDTTLFESADSTHLQFNSNSLILRTTDGTEMTYALIGTEYNCTKIKDRNGNYITINYTPAGRINTVIDTLGRNITFTYHPTSGLLTSIQQIWKQGSPNPVTHNWATFEYGDTEIQTNFPGFTVFGPANGTDITTLSKVTLPDGAYFDFSYTSWGQVWKVSHFSGGHLVNHRAYKLPGSDLLATGPQADCPRFTERRDWAQYWNGDVDGTPDSAEDAVTGFAVPVGDTWNMPDGSGSVTGVRTQLTLPDNTSNKIYFIGTVGGNDGWRRSLPALVNTYDSAGALRRQTVTAWTQDNTGVPYKLNPRKTAVKLFDPEGNQTRTEFTYEQFDLGNGTSCQLQRDVYEYPDTTSTTKLRSTRTLYNMAQAYKDRRILGLVSEVQMFEGDVTGTLRSKVAFGYDEGTIETTGIPVQHDNATHPATFPTRGNQTSTTRYNVNNTLQFTKSTSKYNRAGSVVSNKDASDHEILFSYADQFSDDDDRDTWAYPTTVTDADDYTTTAKYNFDFGLVTQRQTPQPNTPDNDPGPIQYSTYDAIGRLVQVTNSVNTASVRTEYHLDQNRIYTFKTIEQTLGEAQSFETLDGHGRVVGRAKTFPDVANSWSGQKFIYDVMGRTFKTSNPAETTAVGAPAAWNSLGDDSGGWLYSEQTYDWNGRPLVTKHQNNATRTAAYSGCGCAGGAVVTLTDEGGFDVLTGQFKKRQQKVYSDVLGRSRKTEILNWENGSVYSATVNTYNARDQVIEVKEYAGPEASPSPMVTTLNYDGYGRLENKHIPQQSPGTVTAWTYNADDTVNSITDARGATQTFAYNDRHQTTNVTYSGVSPGTATASFAYDGAGNRTSMTDGLGSKTYQYDGLSRLTLETRVFAVGSFPISYTYNLAGQLSGLTDPFGQSFTYVRNIQGQLKSMTGSPYAGTTNYISDVVYRAWGAPKTVTFPGGSTATTTYTSRMQPSTFRGGGIREDYGYFADGHLASITDLDDTPGSNPPASLRFLSRDYDYDHVGRVTGVGGTGIASMGSVPLGQGYGYDAFGNMTSRTGSYYNYNFSPPATDTATFVNNRRSNWAHNAEGQATSTPSTPTDLPRTMTYDAAGRRVTSVEQGSGNTITYSASYDGDGELSFESTNNSFGSFSSSYIVRSTVLDGEVLTRLSGTGGKLTTHVPAEGLLFATQRSSGAPGAFVMFTQRNPLGLTETNRAIYDPLGNFIPFRAAPDPRPPAGSYNSGSMSGLASSQANPDSYAVGCIFDGIPTPCNKVMQALDRLPIKEVTLHGFSSEPWFVRLMSSFSLVETRRETTEQRSLPPSETMKDADGNSYDFIGLPPKTVTVITMEWVMAPGSNTAFTQNKKKADLEGKRKDEHEAAQKEAGKKELSKDCKDLLAKLGIKDPSKLSQAIGKQNGYEGINSNISLDEAGILKDNPLSVKDAFEAEKEDRARGIDVLTSAMTGAEKEKTRYDVYFNEVPITAELVMHEAIHSLTMKGDEDLAKLAGITSLKEDETWSQAFDKKFKENCFKSP